ncbi:MAG: hypothetical protein COC09_06405 [Gammaproteobacteria bacterium]|nr:hypothetical protein [Gammaproteobacteria bacterium]PCH63254.1 MAG: hypothetical protein COC09_06405 [Gammaproteobacteria bacterium]
MSNKLSSNSLINMFQITTIDIDEKGVSVFGETIHELDDRNGMFLSGPINALNFRLRKSHESYEADWHVAGDPTLLLIMAGTVRISLRNGDYRDFSVGDLFIAKDKLLAGGEFDCTRHGHRAEVIGGAPLSVVHIKLAKLDD